MNTQLIIDYLNTYTKHEQFYKKYFEKKKNPKEFQDSFNCSSISAFKKQKIFF